MATSRSQTEPLATYVGDETDWFLLAIARTEGATYDESHRFDANGRNIGKNGDSASGKYQFVDRTWRAYGGGKYSAHAYQATPAQQDEIARRLLAAIWKKGQSARRIPKGWFIGDPNVADSFVAPGNNNGLTAGGYADIWIRNLNKILANPPARTGIDLGDKPANQPPANAPTGGAPVGGGGGGGGGGAGTGPSTGGGGFPGSGVAGDIIGGIAAAPGWAIGAAGGLIGDLAGAIFDFGPVQRIVLGGLLVAGAVGVIVLGVSQSAKGPAQRVAAPIIAARFPAAAPIQGAAAR